MVPVAAHARRGVRHAEPHERFTVKALAIGVGRVGIDSIPTHHRSVAMAPCAQGDDVAGIPFAP